jgi:DNA-binding transcriptional regulator YhcF (GntR family)
MPRHVDIQMLSGGPSASRPVDTDWLARHLRFNFYLNRLAAGDRLPSVRDLARTLHMSPNTALELYKELENAGVVETRPRSGTFLRRVGTEDERTHRDLTMFAMMVRLSRRLELIGVSPADFAGLFLRYAGAAPRQGFSFAFIASAERFQILERQLAKRLKWRLPVVALSPDPGALPTARERIGRDPSIGCLMSSYLYCDLAFRLADEFQLQVIVERLDPVTAEVFEPPNTGTRVLVTRDTEFAANIRQLTQSAYGPERAGHMKVASLAEPASLERLDEADEIYASWPAFDAVSQRFGGSKRIMPLHVDISKETLEDLLFHYVFVSKKESEG